MASFDPPQKHYDPDFEARLLSTFAWLKEQTEDALRRITALERDKQTLEDRLAEAVSDAKFWANQARGER